jgi:hypothetical protein
MSPPSASRFMRSNISSSWVGWGRGLSRGAAVGCCAAHGCATTAPARPAPAGGRPAPRPRAHLIGARDGRAARRRRRAPLLRGRCRPLLRRRPLARRERAQRADAAQHQLLLLLRGRVRPRGPHACVLGGQHLPRRGAAGRLWAGEGEERSVSGSWSRGRKLGMQEPRRGCTLAAAARPPRCCAGARWVRLVRPGGARRAWAGRAGAHTAESCFPLPLSTTVGSYSVCWTHIASGERGGAPRPAARGSGPPRWGRAPPPTRRTQRMCQGVERRVKQAGRRGSRKARAAGHMGRRRRGARRGREAGAKARAWFAGAAGGRLGRLGIDRAAQARALWRRVVCGIIAAVRGWCGRRWGGRRRAAPTAWAGAAGGAARRGTKAGTAAAAAST